MKKTFFISGKYTRLEQSVPYNTFIQSCRNLIRQVMAGDEHEIQGIRDAVCAELGEDIGLLVNIIPELKKLKPDAGEAVSPDYPPPVMHMRIMEDLQKFLGIFGTAGISVVMFQDDLQWADSESTALFLAMMENDKLRHFLLIGSYRDNDAEMLPPCALFLKNLEPCIPGVQRIRLPLLSQGDVRQFVQDTFGAGVLGLEELSMTIHSRTGGNPFFIRQFSQKLYHENYIAFRGGWQIDIERINKTQMTDNLVSFMVERISKFSSELQEILHAAACMGIRINLELLSRYFSTSSETLSGRFMDVMREGMVIMHDGVLHFAHDRIQESLYSVLDETQKANIHYRFGKLMHDSYPVSGYTVFDIADQLFLGRNVFTGPADHILAASVNHAAGLKARGEAAFSSAHEYF